MLRIKNEAEAEFKLNKQKNKADASLDSFSQVKSINKKLTLRAFRGTRVIILSHQHLL